MQASDPLELLAQFLIYIPDPGHVLTRCYGWSASRTRAGPRTLRLTEVPASPTGPQPR